MFKTNKKEVTNNDKLSVKQWYNLLSDRLEKAPKEASRFYNLQLLPRLMHQLQKQSKECNVCLEKLNNLNNDTTHIVSWFKDEGVELKNYQDTVETSIKHLQEAHNIVPKGLWLSRIVVVGLIIGAILGYGSHFIVPTAEKRGLIILGIMAGIFFGWIYGKIYERKLKKRGNIF